MAEYIDRQKLLEKAKSHLNSPFGAALIIAEIEKADFVEVVRCKDCKWAEQVMIGQCVNWICKCPWMFERYVRDGFCSYGERK